MNNKPKTILVVDDDQDMLTLLSRVLTTTELKILLAPSVATAKELLDKEAPHIVITDLHMTPENGYDLIQYIRSQNQYDKVPLLVLSALNDFASVKKAIALGVNDYVIKPLQSQMLLRKIRKALLNQDYARWDVPETESINIEITLDTEVIALGEEGCVLSAPFKISKGRPINIKCFEFSSLGLDNYVQTSESEHKHYLHGGKFLNEIRFTATTKEVSARIKQLVNERNN